MSDTHCDDMIHEPALPLCVRYFLLVHRLPPLDGTLITAYKGSPVCYATYEGKRVRLVMASRFGDIGITTKLHHENGYEERVSIDTLSDFGDKP